MFDFQVRASAVFALGTLLDVGSDLCRDGVGGDDESDNDEKIRAEISIVKSLLSVASDGSPLVRAEVAVGMWFIQNMCCYLSTFCCILIFVCLNQASMHNIFSSFTELDCLHSSLFSQFIDYFFLWLNSLFAS